MAEQNRSLELVRVGLIPTHIDPRYQYASNERPALAITESGWIEIVTSEGIVQRDIVKKDCGCGKKARA